LRWDAGAVADLIVAGSTIGKNCSRWQSHSRELAPITRWFDPAGNAAPMARAHTTTLKEH